MSIYADFCLYLQSKHDQNTTILLDRHGLEMLKMAWIVHVFLRDATTMANFRLVVTKRTPDRVLLFFVISTKRQNRVTNGLKRKIEGIRKGSFHNEPYPIINLKN